MGGKSCLIRQTALIVIMAQAGSFVPAASARLHAFDAVLTRMGAADNIALGRSTFLEELSETSAILAAATPRSLVIIDELGRGTSTRDGVAIAHATLAHIVDAVRCLTLFVTHYPEVATLKARVGSALGCYHMACVAEAPSSSVAPGPGADDAQECGDAAAAAAAAAVPKVTFLYRATRGVAQASFGLSVARMAGLPEAAVGRAAEKARGMEAAAAARGAGALEALARRVRAGLEAAAVDGGGASAEAVCALQREAAAAALGCSS
jgi:DNA mismatch repair protein MSH3